MAVNRKCDVLWVQYPNPDHYPPTINALRVLAANGLTAKVLCCADWPETGVSYPEGVRITRVGGKPTGGLLAPLFFAYFLMRCLLIAVFRRPRVIYGCNLQGIVTAGIVGETLRTPYIHHCYDLYLPAENMGFFDRRLKPLERLFSKRAQCLVFPSESKLQLFFKTSKLSRPYLLVANSPLKQPERSSNALEQAIREKGGDPKQIVLYQGSIGPGAGIGNLIRSIPGWPDGATLALLGIIRPQEYVEDLMSLAREMGVGNRVFYLGVVNYDDLFSYTRSADLGTFLPTADQSNFIYSGTAVNKVMEYMACGVPAVVASNPHLQELMSETGAGLTADSSCPEAIALTVRTLLTDHKKGQSCSSGARSAHLEKYHFEHQFKPVLEVMLGLCSKRHLPSDGTEVGSENKSSHENDKRCDDDFHGNGRPSPGLHEDTQQAKESIDQADMHLVSHEIKEL